MPKRTDVRKVSANLIGLSNSMHQTDPRIFGPLIEQTARKRKEIEKAIYPVGFYRNKAKIILDICKTLIKKHQGKVPDNMDDLLNLKGVGRKTANLVLTMGYNRDGICVDTHVHRISNRLGWVKTKTPDQTEKGLEKVIPKSQWRTVNSLLVSFGQEICRPVYPKCPACPVNRHCPSAKLFMRRSGKSTESL